MFEPPELRLALGLGDQELEQRLRPALDTVGDVVVVAQCLAADQLLAVLDARQADAFVVAWNLHRLTDAVLAQLERSSPVILLVPDPDDARWQARRDPTLSVDADAADIHQALLSARRGERATSRLRPANEPLPLKAVDRRAGSGGRVVAVTGGFGSPGRTTVAINLAAALGAFAPTVLLEMDLAAPAVVAYLDRDPSRNICTLAHAVRDDPRLWSTALAAELQPLAHHSSAADVLCGPPKREMRTGIVPAFVDRLIDELAAQYGWVVIDIGPDLAGLEPAAANHRAAIGKAELVLVVVAADLVGLWHGRTALDQLESQLGIERQAVRLVLNRLDTRHHHGRADVEWHLGASVAASVPFDHHSAQRATSLQQPLLDQSPSRAGRAFVQLAASLNEGKPRRTLPTGSDSARRPWFQRWLPTPRGRPAIRQIPVAQPATVTAAARRGSGW
jgi:pilus assembly protein CpaE